MENRLVTAVTVMDLSVVFDTVSHELLLPVLREQFGKKDIALNWYENYLKPRYFKVCIDGTYSTQKTMDFSVPQAQLKDHIYLFVMHQHSMK